MSGPAKSAPTAESCGAEEIPGRHDGGSGKSEGAILMKWQDEGVTVRGREIASQERVQWSKGMAGKKRVWGV